MQTPLQRSQQENQQQVLQSQQNTQDPGEHTSSHSLPFSSSQASATNVASDNQGVVQSTDPARARPRALGSVSPPELDRDIHEREHKFIKRHRLDEHMYRALRGRPEIEHLLYSSEELERLRRLRELDSNWCPEDEQKLQQLEKTIEDGLVRLGLRGQGD